MFSIKKTLLATLVASTFAATASAATINESFDGAWTDPAAIGTNKGLLVDYIPSANVFFFAFFTYDEAGNQVWLTSNFVVEDGVSDYTVDVATFTGGRSASAGAPAATIVGSVDLSIGCHGIAMAFTPNVAGAGLQAGTFDFVPSVGLDTLSSEECVVPLDSCPAGTTALGDDCQLPNSIATDLHLPAGKKYIISGEVDVEEGAKLSIDPGVVLQGAENQSVPNFLAVLQGAQIYAMGTEAQPIVFKGPTDESGSWSGLVIAGRSICNVQTADQPCQFEAVPSITYGGDQHDDNSGVLRYVRIEDAGFAVAPDEELNALTLLAVGSGTTIDHVQMDNGLDDGVEFFGGTVNARYMVCSNMGDDCFDMDQGFAGKLQFLLGYQGSNSDVGGDSNGIEADNNKNNNDLEPRSNPSVSNVTLVGGPVGNEGVRLRRGMGGEFRNVVVTGFQDSCLNLDDAGTFTQGGSGSAQGSGLNFQHSFIGSCGVAQFEDKAEDPYLVSSWYNAGAGNAAGDAMLVEGGFLPQAGSPVLEGGEAPSDPFFVPTGYKGAFAGPRDNWTKGWTVGLPGQ